MAKTKTVFYCTGCGNESPKWQGRCPACGQWNTLVEHVEKPAAPGRAKSAPVGMSRTPRKLREVDTGDEIRFFTGMGELDRVLGGGAVEGSLVLAGGAPGIGKSTLLLQICAHICTERRVLYASGEESERQLKLRAERLGVTSDNLYILSETRLGDILEAVEELKPDVLIAPYAYAMGTGWELTKALSPKVLILLHLPDRENDPAGLWESVETTLQEAHSMQVYIPQMGQTLTLN